MTGELFTQTTTATPEPESPPNFWACGAERKAGVAGWKWFKVETVGDGREPAFLVEGGIPRILQAGKRKGKETWKGQPTSRVVVTYEEREAEAARYEATTGKCRQCAGSGQQLIGSHVTQGNTYGTCRRCAGKGAPKP